MKVLCIGHTSYAITCPMDNYPVEGEKYQAKERIESGGGTAFNISYLLSAWGVETHIASVVGSDDYGTKIKKELEQNNVKVENLETNFEKPTPLSFVLVNKSTGQRTMFNVSGEAPHIKKEEWAFEPDIIIGDAHEYHAVSTAIDKFQKKQSFIVADKADAETIELCKFSTYILGSQNFAEELTKVKIDFNNPNTLVEVYNRLLEKYPRAIIIITLGSRGALYAINGNINVMQGLKTEPKDTTSAGDVFRGALIYGVAVGYDLEKCIQIANIAAGLSTERLGSKASIPNLNEVLVRYTQKFGNQTPQQNVAQSPVQNTAAVPQAPVQQPAQPQQQIQPAPHAPTQTQQIPPQQ